MMYRCRKCGSEFTITGNAGEGNCPKATCDGQLDTITDDSEAAAGSLIGVCSLSEILLLILVLLSLGMLWIFFV